MTPLVLLVAASLGFGASPHPSLYAGYAERPHQGYARTVAGFELVEGRSTGAITVSGRVVRPGTYRYCEGMTVSSVIGKAGSFLSAADYENIKVIRQTDAGEAIYRLSYHIMPHRLALLKPGDVLIISSKLYY